MSASKQGAEGGYLFAARSLDGAGKASARAATRAAHLEWAHAAPTVLGGPLRRTPEDAPFGSLLILRASDAASVTDELARDPYVNAAVFASTEMRQWRLVDASEMPRRLFLVWCRDRSGMHELRADTRAAHLEWWRAAGRRGCVGPFVDDMRAVGSMLVCEGQSVEEVTLWAQSDPYSKLGLFESVDVCIFDKVIDRLSEIPQLSPASAQP